VSSGGQPLTVSPAGLRVLALLAVLHGREPAHRVTVAEQLWPETTTERAVSNLRSTLWRMPRPRSRTLVASTARTVQLAGDLAVDLWEADDRIGQEPGAGDVTLLAQDLLPRWDEEWLHVEREGFRQRRLHALESAARSLCHRGRYADALTAALSAVRAEPLRETAHLRVIEVHLAEGNQSEAVRQYDHYRRLLHSELGLGPSESLRSVMAPLVHPRRRSRARHPAG
jgi:DNA-binding SARP family transcriptional activator